MSRNNLFFLLACACAFATMNGPSASHTRAPRLTFTNMLPPAGETLPSLDLPMTLGLQ